MAVSAPVHSYQQILDQLRREGRESSLLKPMSELISLFELATTFNASLDSEEILAAALRIVMAELDAERAALFVRSEDGRFATRAAHGLPVGAPSILAFEAPLADLKELGPSDDAHLRHGLALLCPVHRRDRLIAVLGLGPPAGGRRYGWEQRSFLRGVTACAATAIENGLIQGELRRMNQKLSMLLFQLHNLFDLSRDLAGSFEEDAIQRLVTTTAMGHFVVSRCALYLLGPHGLAVVQERGLPPDLRNASIPAEDARAALRDMPGPTAVAELTAGPLRRCLEAARLVLAVPLVSGARVEGLLAVGSRASGAPFSEEDRDFAQTLARQTLAALDNARSNRLRVEKQRQDHELQVAHEIQRSLLPPRYPELPGFEVAAESRSCYEVGGDSYDWIPLGGDRLALVVADVSGKGTPASLLMASVHAYVQALAGTAAPAAVVERLNRFLFASTQPSRFVTLFYAELEASSRKLAYVNAGHVPPFRVARDGKVSRLSEGGLALGLLDRVAYETGQVVLEPGDTVAMVTDGVTEVHSPDDREFGDERVCESLRMSSAASAAASLESLLAAVTAWGGRTGHDDDLTALILKAR